MHHGRSVNFYSHNLKRPLSNAFAIQDQQNCSANRVSVFWSQDTRALRCCLARSTGATTDPSSPSLPLKATRHPARRASLSSPPTAPRAAHPRALRCNLGDLDLVNGEERYHGKAIGQTKAEALLEHTSQTLRDFENWQVFMLSFSASNESSTLSLFLLVSPTR